MPLFNTISVGGSDYDVEFSTFVSKGESEISVETNLQEIKYAAIFSNDLYNKGDSNTVKFWFFCKDGIQLDYGYSAKTKNSMIITNFQYGVDSTVSVSDGHVLIDYPYGLTYGAKFTVMLIGR